MYRTLLVGVWLSSGRSNVKVPHLALQGVSKEFVLIGCVLRKRSVFILYFTRPHLFNENKLRTFTLPKMITTQVKVMRCCYKNPVATDKTKT